MVFQICLFICCAILRAVVTLLRSEGLPDVFLDDLVNYKFYMKKRPEGFISQTLLSSFVLKHFLLIC